MVSLALALKTSQSCLAWSATMYRTRQDLSSAQALTTVRIWPCQSVNWLICPNVTQLVTDKMRTESCSSFESLLNASRISASELSPETTLATSPRQSTACRLTIGV